MNVKRVKIPKPISGGLVLSYKCSAECRHCIYACSPRWKADWIQEEVLERGLSQLSGKIEPSPWGHRNIGLNHGLHFTGGEPFLNFPLLLKAVEMASDLGIPSTFVETNCFWCASDEVTREKLELLRGVGLRGIMISVNPFYAEYIPFERTERCIRASLSVFGKNVAVYQLEYYRQFVRLGIKDKISLEDYVRLTGDSHFAGQVEMFLQGRATYRLREYYPAHPARRFFGESCVPPVFRGWHNHFDNYGNFVPGYCGGISLGSWLDLDGLMSDGIDLDEHPVLRFLITEDTEGLFHFARDLGYEESAKGYLSKCDLCTDIRKYLVSRQDFPELSPRAFYDHLEQPSERSP